MQHDVIIVGAGPAGSAAAIILANRGHDVLLIDQHGFPRDKVCGDGIPPGSVQLLNQLGLGKRIAQAEFNLIDTMRVISPENTILNFNFSPKGQHTGFYIAPRREFDYLLQQQALASGAQFRLERVSGIIKYKGAIKGVKLQSGEEIFSQVVIGADGANSIVARALRPEPLKNKKLIGIRGYISGLETNPTRAEFFFLRDVFPSYGWIFPINPHLANVGLGLYVSNYQTSQLSLKQLMSKFLEHEYVVKRLGKDWQVRNTKTWFYQLAEWMPKSIVTDGALLVGDAAPLMDPLSGEGIHNALHSGIIAGEVIDKAIRGNDCSIKSLQEYEQRCKKEIYSVIRRSLLLRRILSTSPTRLEWFFRLVENNKVFIERLVSSISSNIKIQPE